jgi:hypothetical protein
MKLAILDAVINIQRRPRERLHRWPVQHLSTVGRDFDGECGHNFLRGSRVLPGMRTRLKPTMEPIFNLHQDHRFGLKSAIFERFGP